MRIASIAKAFNGAVALHLVEQGQLGPIRRRVQARWVKEASLGQSPQLKSISGNACTFDYDVFMLSCMREAYDETGSTNKAIELGLARTGKLVTSGALILMFAFPVLSSSPAARIKPLAIGLAAGIILDATVIRAQHVPALMRPLGEANWWMPRWASTVLRITPREPEAEFAAPDIEPQPT